MRGITIEWERQPAINIDEVTPEMLEDIRARNFKLELSSTPSKLILDSTSPKTTNLFYKMWKDKED